MGESSKSASTPMGAVLLTYASQDGEAAKRICEALRAAGIEVCMVTARVSSFSRQR
jgi:hypothetical protein